MSCIFMAKIFFLIDDPGVDLVKYTVPFNIHLNSTWCSIDLDVTLTSHYSAL